MYYAIPTNPMGTSRLRGTRWDPMWFDFSLRYSFLLMSNKCKKVKLLNKGQMNVLSSELSVFCLTIKAMTDIIWHRLITACVVYLSYHRPMLVALNVVSNYSIIW